MRVSNVVGISRLSKVDASVVNLARIGGAGKRVKTLDIDEGQKYTEDEIIDAIEKANRELIVFDRRFEFSIHEKTKQVMVKVIDATNGQVIREIPPEKILDVAAAILEMSGLLLDEKA